MLDKKIDRRRPNLSVRRLNEVSRRALRTQSGNNVLVSSAGVLTRKTSTIGGIVIRYAMVAENPKPKNSIKINIMTDGNPASSGADFEVECYASILNGARLDMVAPVIVMGSILPVIDSDFGIAIDINAWDTNVIYRPGEQVSNSSKVYRSLVENNQGNAVTDTDFWKQYTEWDTAEAYAVGTIIEDGDLLYVCIAVTNDTDGVPSTEPDLWELLTRVSNQQWCFVVPFTAIRNVSF